MGKIPKFILDKLGRKPYKYLDKKTRYQLVGDEFKSLKEYIINKYGSSSNYARIWHKRNNRRKIDYVNELARLNGFKNQKEYLDSKYQEKGFFGLYDYQRFKRLRKKYHKSISDFTVRTIQFRNEKIANIEKELEKFIFTRLGMRKNCKMKSMDKNTAVDKAGIYPTIDICSTQTAAPLMNQLAFESEIGSNQTMSGVRHLPCINNKGK